MKNLEPDNAVYDKDEAAFNAEVARIKIILAAFMAKNNLALSLIDELLQVTIDISRNVETLKEVKMKRMTLSKISNGIAAAHKLDVLHIVRVNKFSILFDESTDISAEKHSCIVLKLFNQMSQKVESIVWSIVQIYNDDEEEGEATAGALYQRIMESFDNFALIPKENVLAFCSDGVSVMVSE